MKLSDERGLLFTAAREIGENANACSSTLSANCATADFCIYCYRRVVSIPCSPTRIHYCQKLDKGTFNHRFRFPHKKPAHLRRYSRGNNVTCMPSGNVRFKCSVSGSRHKVACNRCRVIRRPTDVGGMVVRMTQIKKKKDEEKKIRSRRAFSHFEMNEERRQCKEKYNTASRN